ncbi:RND superfamily putative drug exporter [Paenibacillus cellulosilyticus]|uniref:RND superfamily putative drug exporter n=1 Tax=Paenibacillus cellulosilyticus TaxID=375489 RepID=A0A2V2Z083_9BACL|nr:MMPL family transporter [Paenibacillus cellulosilyticus]PWW08678.1 RND superfamily putative drug exporter [Paenibacillus cellulosilyticus]QKS48244.1 MMPL family transporter [Paenibacillus cellulosilyticus]
MANMLYKLGKWCAQHKGKTILIWVVIVGIIVVLGSTFTGEKSDQLTIPGTESQNAIDLLAEEFSVDGADGTTGGTVRVVFKAPEGTTFDDAAIKEAITTFVDNAKKDTEIGSVSNPYTQGTISADKQIGYMDLTYKEAAADVSDESKELIRNNIELVQSEGIQTESSGTVQVAEGGESASSELFGIVIAYVVLGITFLSILLAGVPLVAALIGVLSGTMLLNFGSSFIEVTGTASSLSTMLGLAVGIDYALLIIFRVRQEARKCSIIEAIATANATAGSAVLFAGLTVIIALVSLAVVNIPFLTQMGLAASLTVLFAMAISVTLVPALLSCLGNRLIPRRQVETRSHTTNVMKLNIFGKWARFVSRFSVPVIVISLALIASISIPALHMKTGLPDDGFKSTDTTARRAYDLLAEGFGPGFHGQITAVVKTNSGDSTAKAASDFTNLVQTMNGVVTVTPPVSNESGTVSILTIVPSTLPTSEDTEELVHSIRAQSSTIKSDYNADIMLTGTAVVNIDISNTLLDALPVFIATIVGLGVIILAIVFRSILVPLKAIIGFLFTIFSSLGIVTLVFQDGYLSELFGISSVGPILNFLPILLVAIVFGLAMDYQVFLVTRMREDYAHSGDAKNAVISGMQHNGLVVTTAAVIMISVFGSFIMAEDAILKSLGLALTAGVIIDAFLIRMTLVPAIMSLLGKKAWYMPKWLDRLLPKVDIEGEGFQKNEQL